MKLRLTFYGDDVTGSTDAMEALVLAGIPTVLFLEPPAAELAGQFDGIEAIGLAGMSRTMTPDEMDLYLPDAFTSLKTLGAPVTHYKVCSTFDSSPEIGSIGSAIDIGSHIFDAEYVFLAVGAPKLNRFVVFGNHFATLEGITYRLDRHPVMSRHPITPMHESDLRLHLAQQTNKRISLLDVRHLSQADDVIDRKLQEVQDSGVEVIVLDTLDQSHLLKVGRLIWQQGQKTQSFVVGSSGVEFALSLYFESEGMIEARSEFTSPGAVSQVLVMSGSASPWTASQINWAFENGFVGLKLNSPALIDPAVHDAVRKQTIQQALDLITDGQSLILYSAMGPEDPSIVETRRRALQLGIPERSARQLLGEEQGQILKEIVAHTGLSRIAVAGGDTCGHVLKQLAIYALEFIVPLGTAAPLCRASAFDQRFDGLEIALKGGQLGELDFFGSLLQGKQN